MSEGFYSFAGGIGVTETHTPTGKVVQIFIPNGMVPKNAMNDELRKSYQIGEQDAAERLALMFERYGYERAAQDIRDEARKWPPLPEPPKERKD